MTVYTLGSGLADYDPTLPVVVRQLLQMTGSQYEADLQERYGLNWRYYENSEYDPLLLAVEKDPVLNKLVPKGSDPGALTQAEKQLWSGIKPLFNIATRAVNVDRSRIFKAARPVPIKRDDKLEDRLNDKWERHAWRRRVKQSPLYGAIMGNSRLRIIPGDLDPTTPNAKSRLEVYSPEIMSVLRDQHNHNRVIAAKIEYWYSEQTVERPRSGVLGGLAQYVPSFMKASVGLNENEDLHLYTMIILEDSYYTFRDHDLYAYSKELGNSWENTLGMVPVIDVPFIDTGKDTGMATFEAMIPTMDAVNELATMFGQIVKMHADPPILAYGFSSKTKFTKVLSDDGTTIWYIPFPPQFTGTNTQSMRPDIKFLEWSASNFSPLLDFLKMAKDDAESVIPEAAFGGAGGQSRKGSGFEAVVDMTPLDDKLGDIREDQFDAIELALQMAMIADDINEEHEILTPEEAQERLQDARTKYDMKILADPILPADKTAASQQRSVDIADGIISKHTGRLERGMSYREADEEQKLIDTERKQEIEWARQLAEATASATPPAATSTGAASGSSNKTLTTKATQATQKSGTLQAASKPGGTQPNKRPNNPNTPNG